MGIGANTGTDTRCPSEIILNFRSNAMGKTKMNLLKAWCVLTLGLLTFQPDEASGAAIDSSFSYQGRLFDNGSPAGGVYQMYFVLVDSDIGGLQVGAGLTNNAVLVTN